MWNGLKNNKGFILIEVSIALVVSGLLISSGIMAAQSYLQWSKKQTTIDRQKILCDAIKQHMVLHRHLPLPEGVQDSRVKTKMGIPPYRQLGLPAHVAKDGYGRWMYYVVDSSLVWQGIDSLKDLINKSLLSKPKLDVKDHMRPSVNAEMHHGFGKRDDRPMNGIAFVLISMGSKGGQNNIADYVDDKNKLFVVDASHMDGMVIQWMTRCQVVGDIPLLSLMPPEPKKEEKQIRPDGSFAIKWKKE